MSNRKVIQLVSAVEVTEGAGVSVYRSIGTPALRNLDYRPLVACDLSYADWDAALDGVAEVAFLPPVSGG